LGSDSPERILALLTQNYRIDLLRTPRLLQARSHVHGLKQLIGADVFALGFDLRENSSGAFLNDKVDRAATADEKGASLV
jgi:hypothetical protein